MSAMTTPNFLIIGDAKSGSTSLYHYLRQHPDVYMPHMKELRYFAYDDDNPYHVRAKSFPIKTYDEYLRQFDGVRAEKAVGEASPNYLRCPGTAKKIKTAFPDAKIIAILRNHPERLYSAYLMDFRSGRVTRPFDEEVFGRNAAMIKARLYYPDLKAYYDLFPASQIKVLLFDDLKADAGAVARELYRFLGVDDSFKPDLAAKNEGGVPRSRLLYSALTGSRKFVKRFVTPPPALKQLGESIERRSLKKSKIDAHSRRKIVEICQDDIRKTQDLIGRDLSAWLYSASPRADASGAVAPRTVYT
jgi:hypothetical protein